MCGFLIPPVDEAHLISLCSICLQGCFPPSVAIFLDEGFEGTLPSCTSLPMVADGLSKLGFLGVCFVRAMFPIENNEYISILNYRHNKTDKGLMPTLCSICLCT